MNARIDIIRSGEPVNGNIGSITLNNPYPPILSKTAASNTLPAVGASTCASGSQVWNGTAGIFTMNPNSIARNMESLSTLDSRNWNCSSRYGISKVGIPVCAHTAKYIANIPSNITSDATCV